MMNNEERKALRQLGSDMQSLRVNEILAAFENVARGQNSIAVVDAAAILIGRAMVDTDDEELRSYFRRYAGSVFDGADVCCGRIPNRERTRGTLGYVLDDYCSSWWVLDQEGVPKGRRLGLSVVCRNALIAFCRNRRRPDWVYFNDPDYDCTKFLFHRDAVALMARGRRSRPHPELQAARTWPQAEAQACQEAASGAGSDGG